MRKFTATLLVLIAAASFGTLSTIVKLSYQYGFTPAEVTGSQLLFGFLALWLFSLPSLRLLRNYSARIQLKLVLCGSFAGFTGVFYYLALQNIPASLAVILLFQFVWMGILLDWLLTKRRPTFNRFLALLFVLVGTILAAGYQTSALKSGSLVGVGLAFLAACSYTGSIVVSERVAVEVPPILRSALLMTGSAILTLLVFPPFFLINGALTRGLWIWAGLLGLLGVIIPSYFFARGVPYIGSGLTTILGSLELPVVIILSALVLREPITIIQWLGIFLILFGIVISELRFSLRGREAPPTIVPKQNEG